MKKTVAVILSVLMLFSCVSTVAFASDIDDQIKYNVDALIEEVFPTDNKAIKELIKTFQMIFTYLAPTLEDEKAEVQNFSMTNSYDADKSFLCTYSISTDMNFRSLKTNIITMYEYRTQNADGSWSDWAYVKNSNGITSVFTRFNFGYLTSADGSTKYNSGILSNVNIPAGTMICSSAADKTAASIGALADGTVYEIRAVLNINNSFATTTYTSGNYQFVKGVA